MGENVLDTGSRNEMLPTYAHCLRGVKGGVAVVAINLNREGPQSLALDRNAIRYTLDSTALSSPTVRLNQTTLRLRHGKLPRLKGIEVPQRRIELPPARVTFFALPNAANSNCRI